MLWKILRLSALALAGLIIISCDNDDETNNFRPSINYNVLDTAVAYSQQFLDENGQSTVSLIEGNTLWKMFYALNTHNSKSITDKVTIDDQKLLDLFRNEGSPFEDVSNANVNISGAELNNSGLNLRDHVAISFSASDREAVRSRIESLFTEISEASAFVNQPASKGVAGKLDNYLVDAKGIEINQIIQKSLIGALQLDYIGNFLMDEGLNADNTKNVEETNYTQLEHNWDIAYGALTLNPIYLRGATDANRKSFEFGGGAYLWEYNKASYALIYPAYLKGRAAIVNGDRAQLEEQANFIRTEFEKAIANAALGYLAKWKSGATDAARAHAIAEGLGFIYSLRFAKLHSADAAFSDDVINNLIDSEFGFWDLTNDKINTASDAIKAKFGL